MKSETILKMFVVAILLAAVVCAGFVTYQAAAPEQIHPVGIMTGGDTQIHPCGLEAPGTLTIPMSEMIYIAAYPDDECPATDRVLIDTPIRVVDASGRVYWHWFYESRDHARNRTALNHTPNKPSITTIKGYK